MDCDEWRESILHNCLENDTCVIFDRAAAWCELFPNQIRFCNYEDCPRRIQAGFRVKTTNKGNKYFVWRAE